jgi:RNA recognition motif-containing protein
MKLYVGNLAYQTSSDDLQQLFAKAGTVETASVVEDRETGRSRGFGFVEMSSKEEGAAAIQQFNGQELGGRALNVNEAKPRENRNGGGGGGNSRY